MDFTDVHDQFSRLVTYLRTKKGLRVNEYGTTLEITPIHCQLRVLVADDNDWTDSFNRDIKGDPQADFDAAWSWAMSIPPKKERLLHLLVRRMQGLATVADAGVLEDEANWKLWDHFARYMREKAEEIGRNGLPKPSSLTSPEVVSLGVEETDVPEETWAEVADRKKW